MEVKPSSRGIGGSGWGWIWKLSPSACTVRKLTGSSAGSRSKEKEPPLPKAGTGWRPPARASQRTPSSRPGGSVTARKVKGSPRAMRPSRSGGGTMRTL